MVLQTFEGSLGRGKDDCALGPCLPGLVGDMGSVSEGCGWDGGMSDEVDVVAGYPGGIIGN